MAAHTHKPCRASVLPANTAGRKAFKRGAPHTCIFRQLGLDPVNELGKGYCAFFPLFKQKVAELFLSIQREMCGGYLWSRATTQENTRATVRGINQRLSNAQRIIQRLSVSVAREAGWQAVCKGSNVA